jgi:hypothetical protein
MAFVVSLSKPKSRNFPNYSPHTTRQESWYENRPAEVINAEIDPRLNSTSIEWLSNQNRFLRVVKETYREGSRSGRK